MAGGGAAAGLRVRGVQVRVSGGQLQRQPEAQKKTQPQAMVGGGTAATGAKAAKKMIIQVLFCLVSLDTVANLIIDLKKSVYKTNSITPALLLETNLIRLLTPYCSKS